jgi:hypothetical protein
LFVCRLHDDAAHTLLKIEPSKNSPSSLDTDPLTLLSNLLLQYPNPIILLSRPIVSSECGSEYDDMPPLEWGSECGDLLDLNINPDSSETSSVNFGSCHSNMTEVPQVDDTHSQHSSGDDIEQFSEDSDATHPYYPMPAPSGCSANLGQYDSDGTDEWQQLCGVTWMERMAHWEKLNANVDVYHGGYATA